MVTNKTVTRINPFTILCFGKRFLGDTCYKLVGGTLSWGRGDGGKGIKCSEVTLVDQF